MRAKFGRDPTAGSKKVTFKFISRLARLHRDGHQGDGVGGQRRMVAHTAAAESCISDPHIGKKCRDKEAKESNCAPTACIVMIR